MSDQRDKFLLNPSHIAAVRLSDRPDANGFIRSDKGSLLFREASSMLREAVPVAIRVRAITSNKGLEFRWTQLGPTEIDELFAAVLRIAENSDQSSMAPVKKVEPVRELAPKPEFPANTNSEIPTVATVESAPRSLAEFRRQLSELMGSQYERPFVCDGSPFGCQIFLVGANPATEMEQPFWKFWNSSIGFDKQVWFEEYVAERMRRPLKPGRARRNKVSNTRQRLDWIVEGALPHRCLETNIFSSATETLTALTAGEKRTSVFDFLLYSLQPNVLLLHGKDAHEHIARMTMTTFQEGHIHRCIVHDRSIAVVPVSHLSRGWSRASAMS